MTIPPLGAVLAGGAATRLGGAKATVELDGRPLIAYPLRALAEAQLEAIVVAKADSSLPPLDTPVVTEADEPRHPLAGIVAAMRHAGDRSVLVLPCDAPFLSPMLLRVLASATKTTAVRSAGRIHPLIALYVPEALPTSKARSRTMARQPRRSSPSGPNTSRRWSARPSTSTPRKTSPTRRSSSESLDRDACVVVGDSRLVGANLVGDEDVALRPVDLSVAGRDPRNVNASIEARRPCFAP